MRQWARHVEGWAGAVATALALGGCIDPAQPGTLVPPTVEQDPDLPSMALRVGTTELRVHVRRFGDAEAPVLFVLPGSASDVRAYLPLQALADDYHVIMWDLPGNGLSQRVSAKQLDFNHMVEAIDAMREALSPDAQVTLLGHSWSAAIAAMYLGAHPEAVYQAVLMEPPGLKDEFQARAGLALELGAPGYVEMVYNAEALPNGHAGLDYQMLAMLRSGVRDFFCPDAPDPSWPVWRPGALALIVWERSILDGTSLSYDFTPGLDAYQGEVLIVGTACSPIGSDFQRETNLTVFSHASLLDIQDSGHRILTEQPEALLDGLRAFLDPAGAADAESVP